MGTLEELRTSLSATLPDVTSPRVVDGLNANVEIFRDSLGIPHVSAQSIADAFFGQGFVTAQDRLWHMDYDRHRAYGRWAEYAGKVALEQDLLMRRFQILPTVKRDYRSVNTDAKAMLEAYAAGVNAFIQGPDPLPVEYGLVEEQPEPWQPWDCLAVFKVRHIMMGSFEGKLWVARLIRELGAKRASRLFPGYEPGHLLIVPPGAQYDGPISDGISELSEGAAAVNRLSGLDAGSNSWALSGNRTASGKPLLAGDPHRALDVPNAYYQNHVACPEFDAIGLSFPGCPGFPHFGHNAHVAWCVTHAMADYQDLYIEEFDRDDSLLYHFEGELRRAEIRTETVRVRDDLPAELEVASTHHGPIIAGNRTDGYAIAFKYTSIAEPNRSSESFLKMLCSSSGEELDESMRTWVDPCNNFMYVDVHGNIGYLNRGKVPLRSMANAWLPVPGWTGEHEWEGYIPFDELVRSRNPDAGYLVTANNRIVGDEYPYYLSLHFAPDYRARRITELLASVQAATVEDMCDVHSDVMSIPAARYVDLILRANPTEDLTAEAQQIVRRWDRGMRRDEPAPAIYRTFRDQLTRALLKIAFGQLADEALDNTGSGVPGSAARMEAILGQMGKEGDGTVLPPAVDWSALISTSLSDALAFLKDRLGPDIENWRWGSVHFTSPCHTLSATLPSLAALLDPPSVPMPGDGDTPLCAASHPSDPEVVGNASVARYVFDPSDWDNSRWIVPLGASGHPGSPHYSDQTPVWAGLKLAPMLYSWDRVAADSEAHQVLHPRLPPLRPSLVTRAAEKSQKRHPPLVQKHVLDTDPG